LNIIKIAIFHDTTYSRVWKQLRLLPSSSTPPVNDIVDRSKLAEDKSEDFVQAIGNYIMQHDVPFFHLLWKYYGSQNYSGKLS
jgi:hypothetical protein